MKNILVAVMAFTSLSAFAEFQCQTLDGKNKVWAFSGRAGEVVMVNDQRYTGTVSQSYYADNSGSIHNYKLEDSTGVPASLKISVKKYTISGTGSCRAMNCPGHDRVFTNIKGKFLSKDLSLDLNCQ